jgi:hypothetical protein
MMILPIIVPPTGERIPKTPNPIFRRDLITDRTLPSADSHDGGGPIVMLD